MEASTRQIKKGWVWLFCLLIFFCNTFLLPEGLTLILLFSPLWYYCLYRLGELSKAAIVVLPVLLYVPFHLFRGVVPEYYIISVSIIILLAGFVTFFAALIRKQLIGLDLVFRDIVVLNFVLTLLSLPLLLSATLKPIVWYMVPVSDNIAPIPRLKMFTSEASHYSFLLSPVVVYFYCRSVFFDTKKAFFTLFMVTVPLILSFSLGVMLGLLFSGMIVFICYAPTILSSKKNRAYFIVALVAVPLLTLIAWKFFPSNALFVRVANIFEGKDTSSRGRTYEAFILAHKIADTKSLIWGCGPGQLKLLGRNIIIIYYNYFNIPSFTRIPNACAETVAYFGYSGFAIRMGIEIYLFFKTRVYYNPYRLWLFLFVFIYQFTGSYITNAAEYIVWVLAFSNVFPSFSNKNRRLP